MFFFWTYIKYAVKQFFKVMMILDYFFLKYEEKKYPEKIPAETIYKTPSPYVANKTDKKSNSFSKSWLMYSH